MNWFLGGFVIGIILVSYLLVSIVGINYLLSILFGTNKTEEYAYLKLYKKYFKQDVFNIGLGYNKINDKDFYYILAESIKAQYMHLTLQAQDAEKLRLESKIEVIRGHVYKDFWTLTILSGAAALITLTTILSIRKNNVTTSSVVLEEFIYWGIKVITLLYLAWIVEVIINEHKRTRQSIQLAFYRICLDIIQKL